ncbi:MAG: oleate hydratase, partial [Acholeplasmataceae bacterium]
MYDVIIVGGGIAGLTAAAYLTKDNKKVLLLEKEDKVGGLVSTFEYKEFTFDGGIRSIEN